MSLNERFQLSSFLASKLTYHRISRQAPYQRSISTLILFLHPTAYSSDGNQDHVYQFANSQSRPSVSSLSTPTYAVITGSSNSSSEYAVVGGPGSQVSGIDSSSATYSLVGGPVHPTYPAISYDEVPNRKPEGKCPEIFQIFWDMVSFGRSRSYHSIFVKYLFKYLSQMMTALDSCACNCKKLIIVYKCYKC